jgi:hypothetical protein
MKYILLLAVLVATSSSAFAQTNPDPEAGPPYVPANMATLCYTRGRMNTDQGLRELQLNDAVLRMVALHSHPDAAKLVFVWRGHSSTTVPLGSGQIRRQFGLKLRAESGCNLVYVMWRLEPVPGLDISVKVNPGMNDAGDCGTSGYIQISPGLVPLPVIDVGHQHTLEARISGLDLAVWVDDLPIGLWTLPSSVQWLSGPVGIRTDNLVLDAELFVVPGPQRTWSSIPGCEG